MRPKGFLEIFKSLVNRISAKSPKLTDFNVGSALRTLVEATALQFEEFYVYMKQSVEFAIQNSVFNSFEFSLKPSRESSGDVVVNYNEPLKTDMVFPKGTMFCTSSTYGFTYFESTKEVVAAYGSIKTYIPVKCKEVGTKGNIPARAITTIVTTNQAISSVWNEKPFTNGRIQETKPEQKRRFQQYISSLARGTADSIVYGCLEVDGVAGAWKDDKYIGYVKVFVHDSNGELPEELKKKVLLNLENYRAGGIEVEVLPIVKRTIDLGLRVVIKNDYDTAVYKSILETMVRNFLNDFTVAKHMYIADLIHSIKASHGDAVVNILVKSGGDTPIGENELIRCGNLDIECVKLRDWRV